MGSTDDLLQLVKSVHQPIHINEYAGKTVAVDGRAWLLEGASTCALQLAENQDTNECVSCYVSIIAMEMLTPHRLLRVAFCFLDTLTTLCDN